MAVADRFAFSGRLLEVRSMDVVLPVREASELRLRVVAPPDRQVAELLTRLGLELPGIPKRIENVVGKIGG